jgi:hypothetical protein
MAGATLKKAATSRKMGMGSGGGWGDSGILERRGGRLEGLGSQRYLSSDTAGLAVRLDYLDGCSACLIFL